MFRPIQPGHTRRPAMSLPGFGFPVNPISTCTAAIPILGAWGWCGDGVSGVYPGENGPGRFLRVRYSKGVYPSFIEASSKGHSSMGRKGRLQSDIRQLWPRKESDPDRGNEGHTGPGMGKGDHKGMKFYIKYWRETGLGPKLITEHFETGVEMDERRVALCNVERLITFPGAGMALFFHLDNPHPI